MNGSSVSYVNRDSSAGYGQQYLSAIPSRNPADDDSSLLNRTAIDSTERSSFGGPIHLQPNYQVGELTLNAILSRIWLTPANNGVSYLEPASMYTPTDAKWPGVALVATRS